MKRILAIVIAASLLAGCAKSMVICGGTYGSVGVFTENKKNPNLEYDIIVGNVVWSVLLIESLVFPIYFIGFSIYEPVGIKNPEAFRCVR